MDGSWKVQTVNNLKSSLNGAGVVTLKNSSLTSQAGKSSSRSVLSRLNLLTVLRKPLSVLEAAFFPQFISAQQIVSRTPMNGSLVCSGKSSGLSVRNGWVFLNCSLY